MKYESILSYWLDYSQQNVVQRKVKAYRLRKRIIAKIMDCSRPTVYRKLKAPHTMTIEQAHKLILWREDIFDWDDFVNLQPRNIISEYKDY